MKLIIENQDVNEDDLEFTKFKVAAFYCEDTYGYSGEVWDEVKVDGTLVALHEFLEADGIYSELVDDES